MKSKKKKKKMKKKKNNMEFFVYEIDNKIEKNVLLVPFFSDLGVEK